uniref:MFS transporter n=1 Tax=Anaerolinea thermolimosa TaxID=229919 RepID=A0A7C4KHM3_9CHLR
MTIGALSTPNQARHLATIRLLFFLIYAGIGVNFTFINVFYASKGLTGTQIGLITMVAALVGMIGATLWGYLADRTGQARLIMAGGAIGTGILALLYPFVTNYYLYIPMAGLFALGNSAMFTLIDSTTLTILGDQREEYGRYRLGGSFGYILTTFSAGFIYEKFGLAWMFPAYTVVMIAFTLSVLRLPVLSAPQTAHEKGGLKAMVRQPVWIVFTLCVFLVWTAASGSINFLGVAMKTMGGSDSLIGIAATMAAVAEIPFMFFSGSIMRRLGQEKMFWISLLGFTARIGLYGLMPAPQWVIGINLLNGPSYVFFWNSAVNYANNIAPDAHKATAQGLFQATTNLASVASAILAGWMFDSLGPSGLFQVLALGCLAAFIIFGISRYTRKPSPATGAVD